MSTKEALIEYNRLSEKLYKAQLLYEIEQNKQMKLHIQKQIAEIMQRLYELEKYILQIQDDNDDYEIALEEIEEIEF